MDVWHPDTEEELALALTSHSVHETHMLDFKKQVVAGNEANAKVAADMAALAIDGGYLIIGVDEPNDDEFVLAPQPLTNFSERIEQVARNRVDPPLDVKAVPIQSAADPTVGYLVVEIPQSLAAPHVVDGVFWARGEKTNFRMSGAEVARHLVGRDLIEQRIRDALHEEVQRDPTPRPPARMFLVAEPIQAPPGAGRGFTRGQPRDMIDFSTSAEERLPQRLRGGSLSPYEMSGAGVHRSQGLARSNLAEGRSVKSMFDALYSMDIEVQNSGAIRVLVTGFTHDARMRRTETDVPVIQEANVVAWAHRIVGLAVKLSEHIAYRGPWGFGVHIYGLTGIRAQADELYLYSRPVYDGSDFENVALASATEMMSNTNPIVDRLVGDLVAGLGVRSQYTDVLESPLAD